MKASSWALGLVLLASVAANFYTTYVAHCTAVALEKITADYRDQWQAYQAERIRIREAMEQWARDTIRIREKLKKWEGKR